jgi:ABC-type sugar transport system ATPase subunit
MLGVRPEQLRLVAPADGLPAQVQAQEYLGAETLLVCQAGPPERPQRLVLRLAGRHQLARGAAVGLAWPPEALHAFALDGGERIDLSKT